MNLAELVGLLRLDLGDGEVQVFTDDALGRCVQKALFLLNRDLDVSFQVIEDRIEPEMNGEVRELLLVLGQINACQRMRAGTANGFSFSSGDKSVDKSKQPEHWAKLEKDLVTLYQARLKIIRPGTGSASETESVLLTPNFLRPVIYEQGSSRVE